MALVMSAEPESSKLSEKRSYKTCVSGKCPILERVVIYQYLFHFRKLVNRYEMTK